VNKYIQFLHHIGLRAFLFPFTYKSQIYLYTKKSTNTQIIT